MCGITGLSRAERSSIYDPRRFIQAALLTIENRGTDASGFAWSQSNGKAWYWKKAIAAHEAAFCAPFPRDVMTAIGHTRWATHGSKHKMENNHPVIDDGVMLVHNGIISNDKEIYSWLDPEYPPKAEVDTAAFAAMLAHPEELYADHPTDLLQMVAGSAAFAWMMTAEPEVLHLARTVERPLTIGWTRLGDLVMSSTPTTLADLSSMTGIRLRRFREVGEGTYLKVIGGEIVEEKSFRPCRTWRYNTTASTGVTTYKWINGKRHRQVGPDKWELDEASPSVGRTTTDYVQGFGGTYTPVDRTVGQGLVKPTDEDKEFWERVRDSDDFWDRVWKGESIDDLLDLVLEDDPALADDLADEIISNHFGTRPQLTVIAGEKGKLPPYDQDRLVGTTEVDQDQLAYEQYLADQDEIDWSQVVPRRGWKERKRAADAALNREDR